jgi:hypothetical protein
VKAERIIVDVIFSSVNTILSPSRTQEDIDACLEVAFISLKWRLLAAQGRAERLSGREQDRLHNSRLVARLLTLHLDALAPAQLVFALFLAGIGREFPGLEYAGSGSRGGHRHHQQQGHPLPDALYAKLVEVNS